MSTVYLDNNATTRLSANVHDAMQPYLGGFVGNPSSLHKAGQDARRAIENARAQVARPFEANAADIVFTSGGTESIHLAILGSLQRLGSAAPLITSTVEHAAGMAVASQAEQQGHPVYRLPVDQSGGLIIDNLDDHLNNGPGLLSIMWVNNETGVIFDIEPIATKARSAGFIVHVDAVQAAGKLPLNKTTQWADLISISAHKMHGPQGVGALWMRPELTMRALQRGGHQERDLRAGTENVAGIVGFGAAAEAARLALPHRSDVRTLRDQFEEAICLRCPNAIIVAADAPRVDNTTTVCFDGLPAESILIGLSERGVYASSGSACSSGSIEPSHVLLAMGLPPEQVEGAIRFSLSRETTVDEIEFAIEAITVVVGQVSAMLAP